MERSLDAWLAHKILFQIKRRTYAFPLNVTPVLLVQLVWYLRVASSVRKAPPHLLVPHRVLVLV